MGQGCNFIPYKGSHIYLSLFRTHSTKFYGGRGGGEVEYRKKIFLDGEDPKFS